MPKLPPPHHPANPKALRVPGVRASVSSPLGRVGGDGSGGGGKGGDGGEGQSFRLLVAFVIPGAPRTKKNHSRIVGRFTARPRVLPSQQYETWEQGAMGSMYGIRAAARKFGVGLPLVQDINCRAVFYRDAESGDANGYYQALADFLEKAGVVANDKQIRQWDGSRLAKDRDSPRVEVFLELIAA